MSLSLENVQIFFLNHNKALIPSLTFSIQKGEIVTLMGPSGCGKSTLLSFLAGVLDKHTFFSQGKILCNNKELNLLEPQFRKCGFLFQDDLLFPNLTVGENLSFAIVSGVSKKERKKKSMETLSYIGLDHFYDRNPLSLSGGQKSRISVMRTLLSEPDYILLDEPFNKLDKNLRSNFQKFVFTKIKKQNIPALLVTHDKDDIPEKGKVIYL